MLIYLSQLARLQTDLLTLLIVKKEKNNYSQEGELINHLTTIPPDRD